MKFKSLLFFWTLLLVSLASGSFAKEVPTRIHDIYEAKDTTSPSLVLSLSDGAVYHLWSNNTDLVDRIHELAATESDVVLTISDEGDERTIVAVRSIAPSMETNPGPTSTPDTDKAYRSATMVSTSMAYQLFAAMREHWQSNSQCYKRAHIWSFQMWKNHGVSNLKIFLFFTRRYIEEQKYKWWFHVSPMVESQSGQLVMDRTFTNGPTDISSWTRLFMRNGAPCAYLSHYSLYDSNPSGQYCYVRIESMYYMQPVDVQNLDVQGVVKNNWIKWELESSARDFNRRLTQPIDISF